MPCDDSSTAPAVKHPLRASCFANAENHSSHELTLPHGVNRTAGHKSGLNIPPAGLIFVRERAMPAFVRLLQFAVALEAATMQLLDKSLLRAAPTKAGSPSPAEPQEEEADAPHPQLMMVGPVGVAIASTRYVRVYEQVSPWSNDDNAGMGAPHEAHTTPTPPASGSQVRRLIRLALLLIVCAEMGFLVEIGQIASTTKQPCAVVSRCLFLRWPSKERSMYVNACSAQQCGIPRRLFLARWS